MADPIFCVCGPSGSIPCHPAPTNVTVSSITQTGATVAFTPTGVSGDLYDLTLTPASGSASVYPNISNPYAAGSLLAGIGYTPSVATRCLTGTANISTGSLFTTLAANAPIAPLGIYFGMGPIPTTAAQIQAGTFQAITTGANYTIAWPANSGDGAHYWIAEPDTEPVKVKSSDGTFDEPIGAGQTFAASAISTFEMYSTGLTILTATTLKTA